MIFFRFLGSPSQDGLQGVHRQAPRPKSMSKWRPQQGFSVVFLKHLILFGSIFEMIRAKFIDVFV